MKEYKKTPIPPAETPESGARGGFPKLPVLPVQQSEKAPDPLPTRQNSFPVRNDRGHFVKGQSGNPSGRPAVVAEVRDAAREYSAAALATLAEIMEDRAQPGAARVAAANALLDRGFGKAVQSIDARVEAISLSDLHLEALISSNAKEKAPLPQIIDGEVIDAEKVE